MVLLVWIQRLFKLLEDKFEGLSLTDKHVSFCQQGIISECSSLTTV